MKRIRGSSQQFWMRLFSVLWWRLVCPLSFVTATFLGFVATGLGVMVLLLEANLRTNREILRELQRQRQTMLEPGRLSTLEELMQR